MKRYKGKIVTVVGARPQFVKAAVLRKNAALYGLNEVLVHTGQHYDHQMSEIFFSELNIAPPDHTLDLKRRSHAGMTGEIMAGVEQILELEKPDWCLVYGDTNSTLAAALAAAKLHIPVCHVEAGLRSFNKLMPEEINRVLTDHVSQALFCSTDTSVANLKNENIVEGVYKVGDIMYDAVKMFSKVQTRDQIYEKYKLEAGLPVALVTMHRAENVGTCERLRMLLEQITELGKDMQLVFPVHPNTLNKIKEYGLSLGAFHVVPPLSYLETQGLLAQSSLVITDSGGLQKEAYFHGVRCVTMREETEWIETIENGWNRLYTSAQYACEPKHILDYGDGSCSEKILEILSTG